MPVIRPRGGVWPNFDFRGALLAAFYSSSKKPTKRYIFGVS
jgi:hypothetical protein